MTSHGNAPALAVWALGLTQIIGYGTLYYSFAILAPAIAADLAVTPQWTFGALSGALFLGSLLAPTAGRLADRHGAGRMMTIGSLAASASLVACALATGPVTFLVALTAMELAACFVLYATAFVAIVQIGPASAQRSITHLTLIAGFASTLFWPLTTALHAHLGWREVFAVFAALNLLVCMPVHGWLARLSRRRLTLPPPPAVEAAPDAAGVKVGPGRRRTLFLLMMAGFAFSGFVLSAILVHMVPLLNALGLGTAAVLASTLFGPAQVASRLINMVFGGRLAQTSLAVIAALLLAIAFATVLGIAPALAGVAAFVILIGLGSGLISIVGGTLPLEVFGREGYGRHVGWMSAARQFSSSFAPFVLALMIAQWSINAALGVLLASAVAALCVFASIALLSRRIKRD